MSFAAGVLDDYDPDAPGEWGPLAVFTGGRAADFELSFAGAMRDFLDEPDDGGPDGAGLSGDGPGGFSVANLVKKLDADPSKLEPASAPGTPPPIRALITDAPPVPSRRRARSPGGVVARPAALQTGFEADAEEFPAETEPDGEFEREDAPGGIDALAPDSDFLDFGFRGFAAQSAA